MGAIHTHRRTLDTNTGYPNLPLYLESYTGNNTRYQWQNYGTLGGTVNTVGQQLGRAIQSDAGGKSYYATTALSAPWELPNLSATPSDFTFYACIKPFSGAAPSDEAAGGYIIDWLKQNYGDRTIMGYGNPSGQGELGAFYHLGQYAQGAAPRVQGVAILTWVLAAGQPLRVYDVNDKVLFESDFKYTPINMNCHGLVPADAQNYNAFQVFGSSAGTGRLAEVDWFGFAADTTAHTTKAQRDAVRAKWRIDLNF